MKQCADHVEEVDQLEILCHVHDLPLNVFGLKNDSDDLGEVFDCKAGTIDSIAAADSDAHICLLYGDKVIRPISHHTYL